MRSGEKTAFVICSILLVGWMILALFFTNQHDLLSGIAREPHFLLKDLREGYNVLVKNILRAYEINEAEYDRLINTSYTMIYKREYEQLREYLSITEQMELSSRIYPGILINTFGPSDNEILRISATDNIPQKGYLIAPGLSAVIGKIQHSMGKTADVIPIWNDQFTAQVMVKNQDNKTDYPDIALIENKQVINFNPAFPYQPGDAIYLSKYEPGGYTLTRYEWTRIGKIAPVKENEIVEKYRIEYEHCRDEMLEERLFFIVE